MATAVTKPGRGNCIWSIERFASGGMLMNTIRVALFMATLFAVSGVQANTPVVNS
jgi:hypothetical protein